jgi:hypothetical protein
MRPKTLSILVLLFIVLASLTSFAQQTYVNRYDLFAGYSFLDTPSLNGLQNGFNTEVGWNAKTWVALGADFSVFTGTNNLATGQLNTAVKQELGGQILQLIEAGIIPPTYQLVVPTSSTVLTFSAGPQFNYRHFKAVTLFARPALGVLHEGATLKPTDLVAKALVSGLIGPQLTTSDNVVFYGFGGGMDFNLSTHFGVRTAADFVHYNVFSNLLNGGRNSVRFSVGPTFRFGGNIVANK